MSDKKRKISITLFVLAIAFTIVGSTLAYWNWQTGVNDQTNVTFRVTSDFSCGADGGGSITSQQKILAPTTCTNENYAFQKPIVVKPTITANGKTIYMDLYLQVNQIGEYLAQSPYFKYALTTEPDSCTSGVIASGTFEGTSTNSKVYLLSDKTYSSTTNDPYYLYIWLDEAETNNNTQNQPFDISLGGTCSSDVLPYNGTIYRYDDKPVLLGQPIATTLQRQVWCHIFDSYNSCNDGIFWHTKQGCINYASPFYTDLDYVNRDCQQGTAQPINYETNAANLNKTFYLKHTIVDDVVTESYVGFTVTPEMARINSGMKAGTYYLRGLDTYEEYYDNEGQFVRTCKSQYLNNGECISPYHEANMNTLRTAFGSSCDYCDEFSVCYCEVSGLEITADIDGAIEVSDNASLGCSIVSYNSSGCDE